MIVFWVGDDSEYIKTVRKFRRLLKLDNIKYLDQFENEKRLVDTILKGE